MTVKEFARLNKVSEKVVRERCKEGIIVLAKKKMLKWEIDSSAEIPPCTSNYAITLLQNIVECKKGNNVYVIPRNNIKKGISALKYLESWAFITIIKDNDYQHINITNRGLHLIEINNNKNKYYDLICNLKASCNIGMVKVEGTINYSNKKKDK